MSQDEARLLAGRIDHLTQAVSRLVTRITVLEHSGKPDTPCIHWMEQRCVPRQEFDSLHREEHDRARGGLLQRAQLSDIIWKALVTLALLVLNLQPIIS